jgi:hypothetical protein
MHKSIRKVVLGSRRRRLVCDSQRERLRERLLWRDMEANLKSNGIDRQDP